MSIDPIDQMKKTIAYLEQEAQREVQQAAGARTDAEFADARAMDHEAAAERWRKILAREESGTRTVTVKLNADVSGFIEGMKQAREATEKLAKNVCGCRDAYAQRVWDETGKRLGVNDD